ncbi:immunoglobulin-like domain-containing protein [Fictibacillus halophilus]|uniref:immunoglobulin-like domain-containing protein n=1 Tax=Fictibacillus halophilus TaxID=1610490 RepID=UPI001CF99994|nr:immunoglobulin-like domain-containing protein [Fictibacillus halophilus]
MSKRYFIFFIILLSLTACKEKEGMKAHELPLSTNGEHSNRINEKNVYLEMNFGKSLYTVNTKQMKLFIKNKGETLIHTGTPYQVDIYKDGSWYKVPFKEDIGFIMVGIVLKPGTTYEETIGLESLDLNMIPGKYRVIKEFHADGKQITLATEFQMK